MFKQHFYEMERIERQRQTKKKKQSVEKVLARLEQRHFLQSRDRHTDETALFNVFQKT